MILTSDESPAASTAGLSSLVFAFTTRVSRKEFDTFPSLAITCVNVWDFARSVTISSEDGTVRVESDLVSMDQLLAAQAILYQPDSWELLQHRPMADDSPLAFAKRQLLTVLDFVERRVLCRGRLLNPIEQSRSFSNKLVQFDHLAKHHPDLTLPTLVSSDPARVRRGNLMKHVSESRLIDENFGNFAQVVDDEVLVVLSEHSGLPVVTQPQILARYEYKSFLFGDDCLTLRFDADGGDAIDIHTRPDALLRPTLVPTDPVRASALRRVRFSMGLDYCAVDYFVTDAGMKILEVNPLPSWSWLPGEILAGIEKSLATLLRPRLHKGGAV